MKRFTILTLCIVLGTSVFSQRIEYLADSLVKRKVIKMEFFSPLTGNLTLGYEQYFDNFTGLEAKVGIIGLGYQSYYDAQGVFFKVGPKFKTKPSYAVDGTFSTHPLRGFYIRPEIAISVFRYEEEGDDFFIDDISRDVISGAVLLNFGNQYILGDMMTLGWHLGLGYGFTNEDDQGYYFGYFAGPSDSPIATSGGITLGFLLK